MSADMLVINAIDIGMTICPSCVSKQNPTYFIKKVSPGETVDKVLYGDSYQYRITQRDTKIKPGDFYKQVGTGFTCTSVDENEWIMEELDKYEEHDEQSKGDILIQAIRDVTKRY